MLVPVVQIRPVRMAVHERRVRWRCVCQSERGSARMRVIVVPVVVAVRVLVLLRRVRVGVGVPVEPSSATPAREQQRRGEVRAAERLAEE